MRVGLMIEGQEDVTWEDWLGLARACEEHGFESLFRSDHYVSVFGVLERGSLDAWTTLAGLAAVTDRIRLGTLVSPATFRHPSVLAKTAVTVDHISGGRVDVGLGAGWHDLEHRAYGFGFPGVPVRMEVLAEQLQVVHRQWSEGEVTFEGTHFRLEGLRALPKAVQRPHPPLIVGGHGRPKSVALAARWADEYNILDLGPEGCRRVRARVEEAWEREDRDPSTLVLSLMTGCVVGADRDELLMRAGQLASDGDSDGEAFLRSSPDWIAGTPDQVVDRLRELEDAGVQRVMLQHLLHRDLEMLALVGAEVIPAVS
jgi:F420-dependent oxidoreductase-like protein